MYTTRAQAVTDAWRRRADPDAGRHGGPRALRPVRPRLRLGVVFQPVDQRDEPVVRIPILRLGELLREGRGSAGRG